MANLQKIKTIAKDKGIKLGYLCQQVGITQQALARIMRENTATLDSFTSKVNSQLKNLEGLPSDLSMYWARHSWATIAANDLDISQDVISHALGHSTGVKVTAVYVDYDLRKVDEAVERMERWVLEGKK